MASMTTDPIVRYSPKPRSEYVSAYKGTKYGPAVSTLIDTSEAWNLAYLSHDYDTKLQPTDPFFTTNVRRTVQARLDGTGPDLTNSEAPHKLVQYILRLPAPQAVYMLQRHEHLKSLPMYVAYGDGWLKTIEQRAKMISIPDPDFVDVDLTDFAGVKLILSKF